VHRHSILVVEDDPEQRFGLVQVLRAEGYVVAEADSAEAALEVLHSEPVDLLVSDYQLGGATGAWLARIAGLALYPAAPRALLMTGHDRISDADGLRVLHKPIDISRFLAEVRQALLVAPAPTSDPTAPSQRIAFILYVSDSLLSGRTLKALRDLFGGYDESQIALTIVDLSRDTAHQAEEHRVVVTPTLLKTFPAPRVWIVGDFKDAKVVDGLLQQAGVEARK
jgi:CheY-like chemotaxis protein